MLRVLATALAVLALTISMLSFHAPPPAAASQALTPGITLIGKGEVSGSALDTSGLRETSVRPARPPTVFRSPSSVALDPPVRLTNTFMY